ncbi:hypothetical protein HYPSUDRAFT_196291 [Hypholoma sublateritium FD-334 SS-4]|uniref:DH domain-containing protein n=1 Tax=Hypholoma sublateritium (strain FD-334 SS-4) TaxID=945553 RepID=A0A0D2QEH3_HYPSF|nr:hypothetical protein HYPSUDRAFT_196291 [Hypholoma sublateritium FD-334 SS-4]
MPQWALLIPRPDPRQFSSPRTSTSSSALLYRPPATARGPPSPPPCLQPLVFTAVDFPRYRLSPPASPVRTRSAPGRYRAASPSSPERAAFARAHSGRRDSNHGLVPNVSSSYHHKPPTITVSEPADMKFPAKDTPDAGPSRIPAIVRKLTQKRKSSPSAVPHTPGLQRTPGDASETPQAPPVAHASLLAPLTNRLWRSLSQTSMSGSSRPRLSRRPHTANSVQLLGGEERAFLDAPESLDHVIGRTSPARQPSPCAPSTRHSACDVIAASSTTAPGPAHAPASVIAAPFASSSQFAKTLSPTATPSDGMVHSRSYSAQDIRASSSTPPVYSTTATRMTTTVITTTTTSTTTTTAAPSSARQRAAPSSWAPPTVQGHSVSEDGHGSTSTSQTETRDGVRRNSSFGALARTWRRWSASRGPSLERGAGREEDVRAPLADNAARGRQGPSEEGARMVRSLDGGRPDMHMLVQVGPAGSKGPGHSAKLMKNRPVSGTAVPAAYVPPPPSYPASTSAATATSPPNVKPAPRKRTVSQGKLTKPRPPPPAEPSPRRAKFTLDTGSDVDLPAAVRAPPLALPPPTPTRPPLHRNTIHLDADPEAPGRRRWTLGRAMADEAISDAGLVRELERMRAVGAWERAAAGRDVGAVARDDAGKWDIDMGLDVWLDREGMLERERALCESPDTEVPPARAASVGGGGGEFGAAATPEWLAAQRVLLVCRELLLTEKRYLALMEALLAGTTATPPPPLMLHYASDVVRASTLVLEGMTQAPGAAGIARAFLAHQEVVEAAYTRWCGAVGGWFVPGAAPRDGDAAGAQVVRKRRSRTAVADGEDAVPGHPLRRSVNSWRRSTQGVAALAEDECVLPARPPRPHTVRDLAILPTQRVTRYVLLYRDLLAHTPPASPARVFVERAVAAAGRIAEKCDRAQGNAAFIARAPAGAVRAGSGASLSSRATSRAPSPEGKTLASTTSGSSASHASSAHSSALLAPSVASSAATTPDLSGVPVEGKPLPPPPPLSSPPLPLPPAPPPVSMPTLRARRLAKRPGTGDDAGAGAAAARAAVQGTGARRTSVSSVSLSLMTSMGLRPRGARYSTPPASAID